MSPWFSLLERTSTTSTQVFLTLLLKNTPQSFHTYNYPSTALHGLPPVAGVFYFQTDADAHGIATCYINGSTYSISMRTFDRDETTGNLTGSLQSFVRLPTEYFDSTDADKVVTSVIKRDNNALAVARGDGKIYNLPFVTGGATSYAGTSALISSGYFTGTNALPEIANNVRALRGNTPIDFSIGLSAGFLGLVDVYIPTSENSTLAQVPNTITLTFQDGSTITNTNLEERNVQVVGGTNHNCFRYSLSSSFDRGSLVSISFSTESDIDVTVGGRAVMAFTETASSDADEVVPTELVPSNTNNRIYGLYTEDAGDEVELYTVCDTHHGTTYERGGIFNTLRDLLRRVAALEDAGGGGGGGSEFEELLNVNMTFGAGVWQSFELSRALTEADDNKILYIMTSNVVDPIQWEAAPPICARDFRMAAANDTASTPGTQWTWKTKRTGNALNLFSHSSLKACRGSDDNGNTVMRLAQAHTTVVDVVRVIIK